VYVCRCGHGPAIHGRLHALHHHLGHRPPRRQRVLLQGGISTPRGEGQGARQSRNQPEKPLESPVCAILPEAPSQVSPVTVKGPIDTQHKNYHMIIEVFWSCHSRYMRFPGVLPRGCWCRPSLPAGSAARSIVGTSPAASPPLSGYRVTSRAEYRSSGVKESLAWEERRGAQGNEEQGCIWQAYDPSQRDYPVLTKSEAFPAELSASLILVFCQISNPSPPHLWGSTRRSASASPRDARSSLMERPASVQDIRAEK
jgi:hypothetical protein